MIGEMVRPGKTGYERAVQAASRKCGVSEARVELILSEFFEQVASSLVQSVAVSAPGFGMFIPQVYRPPGSNKLRTTVGFVPTPVLRRAMHATHVPTPEVGLLYARYVEATGIDAARKQKTIPVAFAEYRQKVQRRAAVKICKEYVMPEDNKQEVPGLLVEDATLVGGKDKTTGADVVRPKTASGKADESTIPTDKREKPNDKQK